MLLEADPLYELRLLTIAHAGGDDLELPGSPVTSEDRLRAYLKWADGLADLAGEVERQGVPADLFSAAVQTVFGSTSVSSMASARSTMRRRSSSSRPNGCVIAGPRTMRLAPIIVATVGKDVT